MSSAPSTTHINLHVRRYPLVNPGQESSAADPCSEQIVLLSLARQKKANALTRDMVLAATSLLQNLGQDPSVRLLLISGEGAHFCAGADLGWLQHSTGSTAAVQQRDAAILGDFFHTLDTLPIPVIALVQGTCAGGGVGLISTCDSVICHDQAQFFLGEVRLGLIPAVIYPYLRRTLPQRKLRWWSLTGQSLSAKEAQALGLCDHVFSHYPEKILHREITALLKGGAVGQKVIKRQLSTPYPLTTESSREILGAALASEEARLGLEAFQQKQPPPWLRELREDLKLPM